MARRPQCSWHKGNCCWCSQAGGRDIYFRDIPFGPPGSPNWRKAQAALARHLESVAEASKPRPVEYNFGALAIAYLNWLGSVVERDGAAAITREGHRKVLKIIRSRPVGDRVFGEIPAESMTATDLATVVDGLAVAERKDGRPPGYAPNYINRMVASVQAVMNWAADPLAGREPERIISANPLRGFSHPATKAAHPPDRYATADEIKAFLDWGYARAGAIDGVPKNRGKHDARFERLTIALIEVSSLTGTRPGELRVAEWGDFEPRATHVEEVGEWWGRITLDRKRWKSGRKTGKDREVFLPPKAVEVIQEIQSHPEHHPRFIWTHRRGTRAEERGELNAAHGEPWSVNSLSRKIKDLRRYAIADGLKLQDTGDDRFVLYRLRHTAAANLLMAGVKVATVAKLLGTSIAMIEKVYASFLKEHLASEASLALGGRARRKPPGEVNP